MILAGDQLIWALAAAAVIALLVGIGGRVAVRRRRREHDELIRGAVTRMCAQLNDDLPTELRQLQRDVVEVLERQDEGVRAADKAAGPVPVLVADRVVLAAAAVVPLTRPSVPVRPDTDDAWLVRGGAPRVEDHPELSRLFTSMHTTTVQQIGMARAVLRQAVRVKDVDEKCRLRLVETFEQAMGRAEESDKLAASGLILAALRRLTRIDLPIPDDGVPGQANAHELRRQVRALAQIALKHREAAGLWRGLSTNDKGES